MQESTEKLLKGFEEVWFFLDLTHLHLEDYFGCIVMVHTKMSGIYLVTYSHMGLLEETD